MSDMIRVLGRVASPAGARVLAVQRGDATATLKCFSAPSRARALAEADLRTSVRVAGLARCRSLHDLDGGIALLLDGAPGVAASVRTRAAVVPPRAALELMAAVGEILLPTEEHDGPWGMLMPHDVSVESGVVTLLDPGSGPKAPPDDRALTWRLGGLLYTLLTGAPYPVRAGMPFCQEFVVSRTLLSHGVGSDCHELVSRMITSPATLRPWPEEAILLARALAILVDGPGMDVWSVGESPLLRDPAVDRIIALDDTDGNGTPRQRGAEAQVEMLFEDAATPEDDHPTEITESARDDDHESTEDEDTPEDAFAPAAQIRAFDEETQPFAAMDDLDDSVLLDEAAPASVLVTEPGQGRSRLWTLLGLR